MTEEEYREMTRKNYYALMRASGCDNSIPVEWINNYLCKMLKGSASFEACGAIAAMLNVWDKECKESV